MSCTKQKEIVFFFKLRDKLQQPQYQPQQQQKNKHRPTEEIQSDSSDPIPKIAINYQPHQPPKTFKLPESVMVKKNVPSNITDLKSTDVWTMMLKKIEWLVFFASDKTQICFQWDIIRKPFSRQVTKTGKKPLKSLTRH